MNRKTFLQRSALLALATAGLPRMARAFQSPKPDDRYISEKLGANPALAYILYWPDGGMEPSAKEMLYNMTVLRYENSNSSPTETKYRFRRAGKPKLKFGEPDRLTLKLDAIVSGADVLPSSFPKTPEVKVTLEQTILLETSKNNFALLKFTPPAKDDDDDSVEGCFLTTACTAARDLPDDCFELQTLRTYRDTYLAAAAEGQAQIGAYYRVAPAIVAAVNARSNRAEIWDHVYATLVVPSVALIGEGRPEDARSLYSSYVEDLASVFLHND